MDTIPYIGVSIFNAAPDGFYWRCYRPGCRRRGRKQPTYADAAAGRTRHADMHAIQDRLAREQRRRDPEGSQVGAS